MPAHTAVPAAARWTAAPETAVRPFADAATLADDATEGPLGGWHLLALATYERPLTAAEVKAVERLPTRDALDVLFPCLTDPARQEALWALE